MCLFLYQNAGWYLIPGVGVSILISKCRLVFDTRGGSWGGCVYFYIECRLVFDTNLGVVGPNCQFPKNAQKWAMGSYHNFVPPPGSIGETQIGDWGIP